MPDPFILSPSSLLATNVSIGHWCLKTTHPFYQLSEETLVALVLSVNKMFLTGSFMYSLAHCILFSRCLAIIGGPLMGEIFFPCHEELCYGWISAHFSILQHQISLHCFFSDWHLLLDELCANFYPI